jgi:hypothetical protein
MKFGYLPNDNLTLAVIRRIDLDSDAKLNYQEFVGAIKPLEEAMPQIKKPRAYSAVRPSSAPRKVTASCQYKTLNSNLHKSMSKPFRKVSIVNAGTYNPNPFTRQSFEPK